MDPLLEEIERFLALSGMKPTRFSTEALSDAHFVRHLRQGRQYYPRTADRCRAFIKDYAAQKASDAAPSAAE